MEMNDACPYFTQQMPVQPVSRKEEDGTDEDAFCGLWYKFERDNSLI